FEADDVAGAVRGDLAGDLTGVAEPQRHRVARPVEEGAHAPANPRDELILATHFHAQTVTHAVTPLLRRRRSHRARVRRDPERDTVRPHCSRTTIHRPFAKFRHYRQLYC